MANLLSNAWNTFRPFLKETTVARAATQAEGLTGKIKAGFRALGDDSLRTMFTDSAREGFLKTGAVPGFKGFRPGYLKTQGIGIGVGAAAGAARAYSNDDGAMGFAGNILAGGVLGSVGAHQASVARMQGTTLNGISNGIKAAWKAR
jgi:hypothetical protein